MSAERKTPFAVKLEAGMPIGDYESLKPLRAPTKSASQIRGFRHEIEPGPVEPKLYDGPVSKEALVSVDSLTIRKGSGAEFDRREKIPGHPRVFPFFQRYRPYMMLTDAAQRYFDSLAHIIATFSMIDVIKDELPTVVFEHETIYTLECTILQTINTKEVKEYMRKRVEFPLTYLLKTYERRDDKSVVIPHDDIFGLFYRKPVDRDVLNQKFKYELPSPHIGFKKDPEAKQGAAGEGQQKQDDNYEPIWYEYKNALLDIHNTLLGQMRGPEVIGLKQAWSVTARRDGMSLVSPRLLEARILAMLSGVGFYQGLALSPQLARSFYHQTKPYHSNANIMFEELNLYLTTYVVAEYNPTKDTAPIVLQVEKELVKSDMRLLDGTLKTADDEYSSERVNLGHLRAELEEIEEENKDHFRRGLIPKAVTWNRKNQSSANASAARAAMDAPVVPTQSIAARPTAQAARASSARKTVNDPRAPLPARRR